MNRFWFSSPKLRISTSTTRPSHNVTDSQVNPSINSSILRIVDCVLIVITRAASAFAPQVLQLLPCVILHAINDHSPIHHDAESDAFSKDQFNSASTLPQTSRTARLTIIRDDAIKFQQCGSTNSHFDNAELRPTQAVSSELRHSAF